MQKKGRHTAHRLRQVLAAAAAARQHALTQAHAVVDTLRFLNGRSHSVSTFQTPAFRQSISFKVRQKCVVI